MNGWIHRIKRARPGPKLALAAQVQALLILRHPHHLAGWLLLSSFLMVCLLGGVGRKDGRGSRLERPLTAESLKEKLPAGRTFEQIKNHYEIERALAAKLKTGSREERMALYPALYDELFRRVPDHDRFRRASGPDRRNARHRNTLRFVSAYLAPSATFVEFGPGDCGFARLVSPLVRRAYAADISDQRGPSFEPPGNFELILYDGFHLDFPSQSADVVFSDQFVEHLHPDDAEEHFRLVKRILRPGGAYVFRSPHAFSGPHDISKYFSATPEGFHLKEWTYRDLAALLKKLDFTSWSPLVRRNGSSRERPLLYLSVVERAFENLPLGLRKFLSRRLLPRKIWMVAVK